MNQGKLLTLFVMTVFLASACSDSQAPVPATPEPQPETQAWQLRLIEDQGFGDPDNIGVGRVIAHGDYLYLGTWNNESGASMYRSSDGDHWDMMGTGPYTENKNDFVVVSIEGFKDYLYVGTWNHLDGAAMFRTRLGISNAAEIVWEEVTSNGFDNPRNTGFTHLESFKGHLYAGCFNYEEGSELWRSDTGDPGSWEMVIPKGWGTEGNTDTTVMLVHDDYLYVGTEQARSKLERGAQLWRTDGALSSPYDQWQQVNIDGFGNPANHNICGLAELNGQIYAGTWNETQGIEVWRATPSETMPFTDWEQANTTGFGNPDFSHTSSMVGLDDAIYLGGFKWEGVEANQQFVESAGAGSPARAVFAKTSDGLNWDLITDEKFLEVPVVGIMYLDAFRGKVFLGIHGQTVPLQLWAYEPVE